MAFKVSVSVREGRRKKPAYALGTDLRGEQTLADLFLFVKDTLVSVAVSVLKEEQGRGFDKKPITIVDGYKNKSVAAVKPFGKIQFFSRLSDLGPILVETFDNILDRSPIDTSQYIRAHVVLHNDKLIATSRSQLVSWLEGKSFDEKDVFTFVNLTPYARRLENLGVRRGAQQNRRVDSRDHKRKSRGIKITLPNGVYFLSCRAIQRKYKNNLTIKFAFVPGSSLGAIAYGNQKVSNATFKGKRNNSRRRSKSPRTYLYPAIFIIPKQEGIS